ncbi:hypothetical protein AXG93_4102s1000 [Marchantia polymorpha subsp. ruderalis]|uniref:AB hydrolase-1 domain-containing protein n=2 Tax=Marchantia polymorpha TaxID=3197 RepID=A0A176VXM5_MARPO|nr:hypothetical protein AXG93_4102s1000 [Marchantia polymorpha subsp. ruderalis]
MLQEVGFTTVAIDMVSHGIDKTSPDEVLSMSQYAKPLTSHLANVTGKVILVSHGLGGGPASYAMETFPEKISKAVFLSGVMPLTGEMVLDALKPTFPALMNTCFLLNYNGVNKTYPSSIVVNRTGAPNCYFNRSPPLDVALATNLMEDTPWAVFYDSIKLTKANYGSIDRYYIRQGLDRIIPYDIQQQIIAHNPPKQVFLLKNGDHCGFFSETPYLFTLLKQIAFL